MYVDGTVTGASLDSFGNLVVIYNPDSPNDAGVFIFTDPATSSLPSFDGFLGGTGSSSSSGSSLNCGTLARNVATTQGEIRQGRVQALVNFASRVWPTRSYNPFAAFSTISLSEQSAWDYKARGGSGGASFGNVNYGANCAQFGFGQYGCGSFAGAATMINSANHLPQGPGIPFGTFPYGKQTNIANMPSVMVGVSIGKGTSSCTGR